MKKLTFLSNLCNTVIAIKTLCFHLPLNCPLLVQVNNDSIIDTKLEFVNSCFPTIDSGTIFNNDLNVYLICGFKLSTNNGSNNTAIALNDSMFSIISDPG